MNNKSVLTSVKSMLTLLAGGITFHINVLQRLSTQRNFRFVFFIDTVLLCAALYISYMLRYEGALITPGLTDAYVIAFLLILIVKLPVFYFFGLYGGMWRYTSLRDLYKIFKATLVSFILVLVTLLYINRLAGLSRSVFVLDSIMTFLFISGHRLAIRYFYRRQNGASLFFSDHEAPDKKRLLLIGAGDGAEQVIRELQSNHNLRYQVVGLIDDDPEKVGLRIHGVPVLGTTDGLQGLIAVTKAQELLITISSISSVEMKRLVALCRDSGIAFKALPGLGELIDGRVSIKAMRDISFKDLLGREVVALEQGKIGEYLRGKHILVTGAGGSIGSELCRQILRFSPAKLLLYDRSEEHLHNIEMELVHELKFHDIVTILGRVQDIYILEQVFERYKPEVVFHAAAYKHVPLVERNPWEAVYNNILATQMLIEVVIRHRSERFVLVSTDKAVRPTNVMGASKRMAELLLLFYAGKSWNGTVSEAWSRSPVNAAPTGATSDRSCHNTKFMAVRFGNVLGSSGSVIPLFKRQIERGGPVTVTHPEVTRYFMLIEESVQLILQAGSMGGDGEIFILRMGEPIKIDHMAREMIRLAGKVPDIEIPIIYTGLRPGEKLYEELITEGEGIVPTEHEKIMVLHNEREDFAGLDRLLQELLQNAKRHDAAGIKKNLQSIIPEYKYNPEATDVGHWADIPKN